MAELPEALDRVAQLFARLPGIGRRSAQRLAFHLARRSPDEVRELAEAIAALPEATSPCRTCGNIAGAALCGICRDARRDATLICVVEQPENLAAIERTAAFRGVYHVLGGAISPLRAVGPDELRVKELFERLAAGGVREVVLATNPTVEGEATALYLARRIAEAGVRATRLPTGLPVGGELEFIDQVTLARAFEGRRDV